MRIATFPVGLQGFIAVTLLAVCGLLAVQSPPSFAAMTKDPQSLAASDLHGVGTAMFKWYKTELKPKRQKAATPESGAKTVDVAQVPVISRDDLAKLLVPKYLKAVPKNDPWGHPYEYRLSLDPEADQVMVVRSAGADGTFSGSQYEIAGFPPSDEAQDLVWMDGYFVRWPVRAK